MYEILVGPHERAVGLEFLAGRKDFYSFVNGLILYSSESLLSMIPIFTCTSHHYFGLICNFEKRPRDLR